MLTFLLIIAHNRQFFLERQLKKYAISCRVMLTNGNYVLHVVDGTQWSIGEATLVIPVSFVRMDVSGLLYSCTQNHSVLELSGNITVRGIPVRFNLEGITWHTITKTINLQSSNI